MFQCGAEYVATLVVDDGSVATAAGITATLDLGPWLIERFASQAKAQAVSESLEFERRGIVFRWPFTAQ